MRFLLDTDVVSEIRRGRDPGVVAWAASVKAGDTCLSALTLGEIRKGVERLRARDEAQANVFETWLDDLRDRFRGRILPVDAEVAEVWGRLNAESPKKAIDSLVAATARVHGLTVVTRNTRNFRDCGIPLVDPGA